jgi:cytochrome P450
VAQDATDIRDKERHTYLRRLMKPVFATGTLDQISPTVESFVRKLINGISEEASKNDGVADVKNWFCNFTFAVCCVCPFLT